MSQTATTPRRSRRNRPAIFVSSNVLASRSGDAKDSWTSRCLHSRPSTQADLLESEILPTAYDVKQSRESAPITRFYSAFTRVVASKAKTAPTRIRPGAKAANRQTLSGGNETYGIGDTVVIGTSLVGTGVAVITAMFEVDGDLQSVTFGEDDPGEDEDGPKMRCRIHWFITPEQLPRHGASRKHFKNEIYYCADSDGVISTSHILGHCRVTSEKNAQEDERKSVNALMGSPSKKQAGKRKQNSDSDKPEESKYCAFMIDSQRGIYYPLNWERHRAQATAASTKQDGTVTGAHWDDTSSWDVLVDDTAQSGKKKKKRLSRIAEEDNGSGSVGDGRENDDDDFRPEPSAGDGRDEEELEADAALSDDDSGPVTQPPQTPRKRKRTAPVVATPRKRGKTGVQPTPRSKRILQVRKNRGSAALPPPPELVPANARLPTDPWLRAMHILHVAARPESLPCRDEEYDRIMRAVEELLEEGSGGCIYISGVPGTGKTATVHAIVRELKRMAVNNEVNPFTYVEINGLRIPEPSAAYGVLWQALSDHNVASDGPLRIGAKEALKNLTRHFSSGGRSGPGKYACIVLMDELDQLMTVKQDVVYNFFNWPTLVDSKLVVLAVANTMDLPERVMTGRVRSRLGMLRINFQPYTTQQLIQIVQSRLLTAKEGLKGLVPDVVATDAVKFASMKVSSISGDARRVLDICRRTVELVQSNKRAATIQDVKEVIKVMQNSPTAGYLRDCSLHERIMLAALLKCMRRDGVDEIRWEDVQRQHYNYIGVLADGSTRTPTLAELTLVLDSLLASHALLMEDGARKSDADRRLLLNLEQAEVERELGELGGRSWQNALSVS